jgi:P pilus assembly chaperone PapD
MRARVQMMQASRRGVMLACALVLFAAATPLLHAQGLQFGLTPPDVELVPAPGGTASGVLVVYNRSPRALHFRVALQDVFIRPSGVIEILKPATTRWSVAGMTRVSPSEFDLEPNRQMPIRVVVTVPKDARGGLYGAIVVSPSPTLQSSGPRGTFAVVAPKLAARLLVPINGTGAPQGAVVNMLAANLPGKGVDVKVVFRNAGNVHARVDGVVTLLRGGEVVAKGLLEESLVLPASVREFRLLLPSARLAPGSYTVRAVMDYGADVLVAGEVTVIIR